MLYPLKFKPIFKDYIWGGSRLRDRFGKKPETDICAESWEISAVKDHISVIDNGFLKGNNLQEIIEVYMGELVGDHIFEKFGLEFPLLIKFLDANNLLSVQVHPDDELARKKHNEHGKTEMWYIIDAEKNAELISGFREPINQEIFLKHLENKTLPEILNYESVKPGDVFFMPAGRVHALCSGILAAEIQQTSDLTYRIYDWDRTDENGVGRETHIDLAIDAINYADRERYRISYEGQINSRETLVDSSWFTTGIMNFDKPVEKDFNLIDSFVIYMCVRGRADIDYGASEPVNLEMGETVLVPASLKNIRLLPEGHTRLLEIFIK